MRMMIFAAIAAGAALMSGPAAYANDAADRTQAIQLCRAETIARAGVAEDKVRLDTVRVRPRAVRVNLDLWTNGGQLLNVRCDVERGAELRVVSIEPALNAQASLPQ